MRTFKFTANTVNGAILRQPQVFYLNCGLARPIGESIVRQYDGNECIVALKVFLVSYSGQLLGNSCYKTYKAFMDFMEAECNNNYMLVNDCRVTLNGCPLTI